LWDLNAHDPSATSISFQGHEGSINIVAISPDNHWLITVGKDPLSFGSNPEERMNRLRSLPLEELIRLACVTAGRNLSQTEWQHFFPQQAHHKTCQNLPP
jgi:hypothetical protein